MLGPCTIGLWEFLPFQGIIKIHLEHSKMRLLSQGNDQMRLFQMSRGPGRSQIWGSQQGPLKISDYFHENRCRPQTTYPNSLVGISTKSLLPQVQFKAKKSRVSYINGRLGVI